MSESVPVTADTKLRLEIEKLQAEIYNLRKPWIKNPATWVSLMTIFVALCGLGFQYVNHQVAAAAAEQKLENAKTELGESQARLQDVKEALNSKEPLLAQVSSQLDQATSELVSLMKEREEATAELAALEMKLEGLKTQLAALPKTPQNERVQIALADAGNSVKSLQSTNNKTIEKATILNRNLGRIKAGTLVNK